MTPARYGQVNSVKIVNAREALRRAIMAEGTPADIAAMQADALVGTQGDWTSGVYKQSGADLGYVYAAGENGAVCMDANDVDARRIARVPRMEATIIADAAIKTAQAAEIERLATQRDSHLDARENLQRIYTAQALELERLRAALEYCARDDGTHPENRKRVAREALKGTPK